MAMLQRIENVLQTSLVAAEAKGSPPKLGQAMRHAVFPGGARIRPQLCMAVALACGDDDPRLSESYGAALELMHCASLVHDDLPCFDDADLRRGQPSVHKAYGERLAVLAGDALIVLAFRTLVGCRPKHLERLPDLTAMLDQSVGPPFGIVAGQAWECESHAVLADYQRAKTGSLFTAATAGGAAAAGMDPSAWKTLGDCLGEAYQVADDIRDVVGDASLLGKPAGQDQTHDRPSAATLLGLDGAVALFDRLMQEAIDSIPNCPGAPKLRGLVMHESQRLVPTEGPHKVERRSSLHS
ncbi:MAG: polyprenyl synthetase family protein [Burkholderiaceae bacterium]